MNSVVELTVLDFLDIGDNFRSKLRGYKRGVAFPSIALSSVASDPWTIGFDIGKGKAKTIAREVLINDEHTRLELLAGIIDTIGVVSENTFTILTGDNKIEKACVDQIVYLCRSLGFGSRMVGLGVEIYGEGLREIPLRFSKVYPIDTVDALVSSIQVKPIGRGDYYGFTLNGNHRYLMGDFTVTHNTCTAAGVMDAFWDSNKQIVFASSIDAIASNPPFKFHECAARLFPRFQEPPFNASMPIIGNHFDERGIIFVSFAKLANRIEKTERFKKLLTSAIGRSRGIQSKKAAAVPDMPKEIEEDEDEDDDDDVYEDAKENLDDEEENTQPKAKGRPRVAAKKATKAPASVKRASKKPVVKEEIEESDEEIEEEKPKAKGRPRVAPKKATKAPAPAPAPPVKRARASKKQEEESEEDEKPRARGRPRAAPQKVAKSPVKAVKAVKAVKVVRKKKGGKEADGENTPGFFKRMMSWYGLTLQDMPKVKFALKEAKIANMYDFVDLDNTILIVDEVHNLFRPLANQKAKHAYVEKHIVDPTVHPNLKMMILTATPGDNVADVMKLINILRNPKNPTILPPNPDSAEDVMRFKNEVRGLVSYFDLNSDLTKFPSLKDNGPVMYPMSQTQFNRYVEAYKDVKESSKNYEKLAKDNQTAKFWNGPRKYSNMLYTMESGMALTEFSSKLPALLENIAKTPNEKHYVYSAFFERRGNPPSQGILAIALELEKQGYEKITVKDAKAINRGSKVLVPGKKRYILALQSEIGEDGSVGAGKALHEMIKIFNSAENKDAGLIHVFLATQGFNEGLDLKAVRHIHIFEPLVTMASDQQTIGRARRYCSHADLDQDKWTVEIHRYLSDLPVKVDVDYMGTMQTKVRDLMIKIENLKDNLGQATTKGDKASIKADISATQKEVKADQAEIKKTEKANTIKVEAIDKFVYDNAKTKMRDLFTSYHSLKEAAVDCKLLHKFHADESIKCLES